MSGKKIGMCPCGERRGHTEQCKYTKAISPFEKFHSYMRGWRCGSGTGIPIRHLDTRLYELYEMGYQDGLKARIAADQYACKKFSYKPTVLRIQETIHAD